MAEFVIKCHTYNTLVSNSPCAVCLMLRTEHVDQVQCLFGPTRYTNLNEVQSTQLLKYMLRSSFGTNFSAEIRLKDLMFSKYPVDENLFVQVTMQYTRYGIGTMNNPQCHTTVFARRELVRVIRGNLVNG